MQAIGFLSRREHSRQELRLKLLDSLRKRAREDAALASAAEESARAAQAQPSNGIDDAFAPRAPEPEPEPEPADRRARATRTLARGGVRDGADAGKGEGEGEGKDWGAPASASASASGAGAGSPPTGRAGSRSALDTLTLATGAALPSRLRASLAAIVDPSTEAARSKAAALGGGAAGAGDDASHDAPGDADLERSDPEAAVDQLLDWLVAHQYLSDERFVESRVSARSRKQGTLRIKLELSRHGLALEPAQAAALRETEFARAQALWQRKFGEVAPEPKLRARQARILAARGFAADVVRRVVGGEEEF